MMRWSLVVLFFCFACQSKPTQTSSPTAPTPTQLTEKAATVPAKVTPGAPPKTLVQLYSKVLSAPRRLQEIDAAVGLNVGVQNCFASAEIPKDAPVVSLAGKVSYLGTLDNVKVSGADKGLESCLSTSVKAIVIGRGRIGPFKMQISTDQAKIPGSKGLILNSPEVKKFE